MSPSEIALLLPEVVQRAIAEDSVLAGFVHAMSALHAPCERVIESVDSNFDPSRTPERLLPFLSSWVDLSPSLACDAASLRTMIGLAAELASRRGTLSGLQLFLEAATGTQGFAIVEDPVGTQRSFHVVITAPQSTRHLELLLRRVIERERPAYVTYDLNWSAA